MDINFGALGRKAFLENYWQHNHCVFKNALPKASTLMDANELAGLALEEGIESRLISGPDADLSHGPFSEETLQAFPEKNATLLVQAVDHYIDKIKQLRQAFDFIPSWRVDDVMISFASDGGGVGPHYDNYDVFLIQGEGSREWRIGPKADAEAASIADNGLRMLTPYSTDTVYTLNEGDMLYVPPGVAHWGISKGNSLCFSIGFRAPSHAEVLQQWADDTADTLAADIRYQDPNTEFSRHAIAPSQMDSIRQALLTHLTNDKLVNAFAKLITEPKYHDSGVSKAPELKRHHILLKMPDARLAVVKNNLFANSHALDCASLDQEQLAWLCDSDIIEGDILNKALQNTAIKKLLCQLIELGVYGVSDDHYD